MITIPKVTLSGVLRKVDAYTSEGTGVTYHRLEIYDGAEFVRVDCLEAEKEAMKPRVGSVVTFPVSVRAFSQQGKNGAPSTARLIFTLLPAEVTK